MKRPLPNLFCRFECYRDYMRVAVGIPYGKDEVEERCINCGGINQPARVKV